MNDNVIDINPSGLRATDCLWNGRDFAEYILISLFFHVYFCRLLKFKQVVVSYVYKNMQSVIQINKWIDK